MTETNNTPVSEEKKQDPVQAEGELRAELARIRGKHKVLKAAAAALFALFVILVVVVFFVYRKISATKTAFEEAFRAFPPPATGMRQEDRMLFGQGVYSTSSLPSSTLGLFTGGIPDSAAENSVPVEENPGAGNTEVIAKAMNKYSERPILKEFIADLKKNPEMAAALASSKGGNPLAMIGSMRKSAGMNAMILKYSTRPEFLKLLTEFMNDPDIKPLLKGRGMAQGVPQGVPQVTPQVVPQVMPQGMSQGAVIQIPSGTPSQAAEEGNDGELTFDASAISGPAKPAPVTSKAPPPVDSD